MYIYYSPRQKAQHFAYVFPYAYRGRPKKDRFKIEQMYRKVYEFIFVFDEHTNRFNMYSYGKAYIRFIQQ